MKLRKLEKKDIKEAGAIVARNYSTSDAKSAMSEMEDMFIGGSIRPVYYVVEDKGEIVGFTGYIQSWIDYSIYQIFWVNVAPGRHGEGIGRMMITKAIAEISKDKRAKAIMLSTSSPEYYAKFFKFKSIDSFKGVAHKHHIMTRMIKR